MLETFYKTYDYLVSNVHIPARRVLMDEINWQDRLIAIKGGRGTGKTDFLLEYARELRDSNPTLYKHSLYINFNDFYFTCHSLLEFVGEFVAAGGQLLLIDQAFKYPAWARELGQCFFRYPALRIIFIASPVMELVEANKEIGPIAHTYNLRGFSFREYLNITQGLRLPVLKFDDILQDHTNLARMICQRVQPLDHFQAYLEHGYYPHFLEKQYEFNEKLVKMMNMILEIDVLLIKQIEVASLPKLRKLLYLLLEQTPCTLNISTLSEAISCSRSTTMNYIKYLKDARLLNLLYTEGKQFPLKPSRVYMQNTNLCYSHSTATDKQSIAETFFYEALHGNHKINATDRSAMFIVDNKYYMDACASTPARTGIRYCAIADLEIGHLKNIPLWLFGFLY